MIARLTKDRDAVFICDNGACYCRDHLGFTARTTGCDISGQPILEVPADVAAMERIACEVCHPIGGGS